MFSKSGQQGGKGLLTSGAKAAFSSCGRYRWWLRRQWQPQGPVLLFVGLNPSRADGQRDDPTLRRLVGFARQWGYGALEVVNLFGRISASPALLKRSADPVGPSNDSWLLRALQGGAGDIGGGAANAGGDGGGGSSPAAIWFGWGNQGAWRGRERQVLRLIGQSLQRCGASPPPELLCLGVTAAGQPRHPLYVASATRPEPFALAQTGASGASCDQRVRS
ncbi:MAG: DUF1643 domain-containing protein [Cyanobacteriota bacterium]|nr:DUF1643 domain-containing protein [Cyanobacteriota bacterium]